MRRARGADRGRSPRNQFVEWADVTCNNDGYGVLKIA
jgi:hypothetical protein